MLACFTRRAHAGVKRCSVTATLVVHSTFDCYSFLFLTFVTRILIGYDIENLQI